MTWYSSKCAKTFDATTMSAFPFSDIILSTVSLLKYEQIVSSPLSLACLAKFPAGSTPIALHPDSINGFNNTPSLEPMSTTNLALNSDFILFANSVK